MQYEFEDTTGKARNLGEWKANRRDLTPARNIVGTYLPKSAPTMEVLPSAAGVATGENDCCEGL